MTFDADSNTYDGTYQPQTTCCLELRAHSLALSRLQVLAVAKVVHPEVKHPRRGWHLK